MLLDGSIGIVGEAVGFGSTDALTDVLEAHEEV
jgi:hypothetical protein